MSAETGSLYIWYFKVYVRKLIKTWDNKDKVIEDIYNNGYLPPGAIMQEEYPQTDLYQLPIERVVDNSGSDLRISLDGPKGRILADVWQNPDILPQTTIGD